MLHGKMHDIHPKKLLPLELILISLSWRIQWEKLKRDHLKIRKNVPSFLSSSLIAIGHHKVPISHLDLSFPSWTIYVAAFKKTSAPVCMLVIVLLSPTVKWMRNFNSESLIIKVFTKSFQLPPHTQLFTIQKTTTALGFHKSVCYVAQRSL